MDSEVTFVSAERASVRCCAQVDVVAAMLRDYKMNRVV